MKYLYIRGRGTGLTLSEKVRFWWCLGSQVGLQLDDRHDRHRDLVTCVRKLLDDIAAKILPDREDASLPIDQTHLRERSHCRALATRRVEEREVHLPWYCFIESHSKRVAKLNTHVCIPIEGRRGQTDSASTGCNSSAIALSETPFRDPLFRELLRT